MANLSGSLSTLYLSRIIWMTSRVLTRLVIQTDMTESFGGVNTDVSRSYLEEQPSLNRCKKYHDNHSTMNSIRKSKWWEPSLQSGLSYSSLPLLFVTVRIEEPSFASKKYLSMVQYVKHVFVGSKKYFSPTKQDIVIQDQDPIL